MEKKIFYNRNKTFDQAIKKDVKLIFKHLIKIHGKVEGHQFDSFYSMAGYLERANSVFAFETDTFQDLTGQDKEETHYFFNGLIWTIKKMYGLTETYKAIDFLNQCTQDEESFFYKFIDHFISDWPKEFDLHKNKVFETYLMSESANDWEERKGVISAFKNLDFYFESMLKHLLK